MSTEKASIDVASSTSDCHVLDSTLQDDANRHQDGSSPSWAHHGHSMLSRRSSLPYAAKKHKKRLARFWRLIKGANADQQSAPCLQKPDGAPLERGSSRIQVDEDTILNVILPKMPKAFKLPRFDDFSSYSFSDNPGDLLRAEASRLVTAAKQKDSALEMPKQRFFNDSCGTEYQDLSRLAERILSALSLCLLDNECIYVEHCRPLANRDRVEKLIQQVRVSQTNGEWDGAGRERDLDSTLDAVFALIDYVSAILAQLLTQVATGDYWSHNVLAVLTQRVTKLKVLLLDMHANTLISCQAGEAVLERTDVSSKLSNGILDEEECEEVLRMIDAETKEGLTTAATADAARYCVDQNRLRAGIDATLRYLLLSLRFQNRSGLDGASFEICSMVYATGFEDFKALLFQDRDLEYSASSDQDTLNTAYAAFSILSRTMEKMKKDQNKPPRDGNTQRGVETTVEWRYCEAKTQNKTPDLCAKSKRVTMRSMEETITAMVPLLLTSSIAVSNLTKYRTTVALASSTKEDVQPFKEEDYAAFFRMYTNTFEKDSKALDVMRLSEAVEQQVFDRCALLSGNDRKTPEKLASKMAETSREMDHWVIDEGGVTVTCKFQVCHILLVAFLIASGGLLIMTAGDRIQGVDPSNLSMYLWVVAGVYLLVQKSRFVEIWPWSDFLAFRVRCRSVSELHAISGISEQFIMAKLLHDERGSGELKTRGPYNKAFKQRDANEGFSIDCPLHMTTLLLSGMIMLKVVTPRGHALVCLDARRGTELKVVEHQGNEAQEHLVCEDIHRLQGRQGRKKSRDRTRLQLITSKELKWKRVQGVYSDKMAEFV